MTISIERLPEEPIIVATLAEPMNHQEEGPRMFQRLAEIRNTEMVDYSHYYIVIDTNGVKTGFSDIVIMLSEMRNARQRHEGGQPVKVILVGSGQMIELATSAMGQAQYGGYGGRLFTSLGEALDSVRAELAEMPAS